MHLGNILLKGIIFIIISIIVSYSAYRIYPLIAGPEITILTPKNGDKIMGEIINITGTTKRVRSLKIFDREIPIDPNGNFHTSIIKQYPHTSIIMNASGYYGKNTNTKKLIVQ